MILVPALFGTRWVIPTGHSTPLGPLPYQNVTDNETDALPQSAVREQGTGPYKGLVSLQILNALNK